MDAYEHDYCQAADAASCGPTLKPCGFNICFFCIVFRDGNRKPVLVENRFPVFQFLGIVCQFCKWFPYQFQWVQMTSPRTLRSLRVGSPVQPAVNSKHWRSSGTNARKFDYTSLKKMTTGQLAILAKWIFHQREEILPTCRNICILISIRKMLDILVE